MSQADSPSAFAPLRTPLFRAVWLSNALSNLGGLIQVVGASWLMLTLTQSAAMVALVQASLALPIVLLSLLAGAVADGRDRRNVMLSAQCFMFLVSSLLALCAWMNWLNPGLLLLFTFLIGCGAAFNAPAWQAAVGDMVPRTQLSAAVALNSMGFNLARSIGPAIGGAIVAAAGAAAAFAVNALSYVALIVVLLRWHASPVVPLLPRESLRTAMAAGVRYVAMSPAIRTVLLRSVVFGLAASSVMALLPLIASELIAGGPLTFGLCLGAFGVGAVLGAINSARLRQRLCTETLVRMACVGFAIATVVCASSGSLWLTLPALLLTGAGWVLSLSTFNVAVQLSAPRWVVARALSLYQMSAFSGLALGSWCWGLVATHASVRCALLSAAGVMLVSALLGRWLPLRQLAELNLEPLRPWSQPSTAVPVEPRTGPVVVTIEYLIAESDVLAFLAAMAERRRIRRRDGARNWRLLRDLGDPQLWIERYETPTWLDYLRHTSRITQDDALIPQRLRALHQGLEPPRVRRLLERQTSALPPGYIDSPREPTDPLNDPAAPH
jgi:MFS family permease